MSTSRGADVDSQGLDDRVQDSDVDSQGLDDRVQRAEVCTTMRGRRA